MNTPVSERIALVAPSLEAIAVLRYDLIKWLSDRGHRVLCITPPGPGKYILALRAIGAQHRVIEPSPVPLMSDWQAITSLVTHFKDWQPNVAMSVGIRLVTLTALAARRAGVRRVVSLVNGLPSDGVESIGRRRFAQAVRASDAIVFHNQDNRRTLSRQGLLPPDIETVVVPGSGVDLEAYPAASLPSPAAGLVFLMVSRLERRRGVMEYKAAAEQLRPRWPDAAFRLVGPTSTATDAVTPKVLTSGHAIDYVGPLDDVRPALAACHVFVYPSYGEGMPRAALEALATGRPVITTNAPGCSETVDEMVSGCLAKPADVASLVSAMESYLKNPGLLAAGSRAARLKAERRFDVNKVNGSLGRVLGVA